jgi:hypothetical protein
MREIASRIPLFFCQQLYLKDGFKIKLELLFKVAIHIQQTNDKKSKCRSGARTGGAKPRREKLIIHDELTKTPLPRIARVI